MRYLPHTDAEIGEMLTAIGVSSIDALFAPIPKEYQLDRSLALDKGLDEASVMRELSSLAARNHATHMISFLGAGIYAHHVPPVVDQLLLRGEFMTAYTPYQAEVAQGTLQAIFEFQTIISELLGLPVANASVYDGASATAEAALMARRITKREIVLVSEGLHPEYTATLRTYMYGLEFLSNTPFVISIPLGQDGRTDLNILEQKLGQYECAAVILGEPNFFGVIEDVAKAASLAHKYNALLITATSEPIAFSIVESPGARGADIAVAEGQPLGLPPQFGGPGVGLFACREGREYLTNLPGRLVGETVDQQGRRGYVLTLSTREQHIRRERATSNICTNHSLCALAVTIRMCLLGKKGFVDIGKQCHARAEYLKKSINELPGFEVVYGSPTFNEFVVRQHNGIAASLLHELEAHDILGGVDLGRFDSSLKDCFLIAVTEQHSRTVLDRFINTLAKVSNKKQ